MQSSFDNPDERLNALVTEISDLTGENYVLAMCRALEERRDRLVARRRHRGQGDGVVRVTLEAEIPEEMLHLLPEEESEDEGNGGDNSATVS